jgi:hypothetical protein
MSASIAMPDLVCPGAEPSPGMQGIERIAVDDANAQLLITYFRPIALPLEAYVLQATSYALTGGQRLFPRIVAVSVWPVSSPPVASARQVLLTLDKLGDFSDYTLTVSGSDIDPFFSRRVFRFRLSCDESFDCRAPLPTPFPTPELPVAIDYLAKDYASFRQGLLDFVSARFPAWTERSEADFGMMLLELLAYTADNLSYMQDRVANEAFLATATQRRSVAGHLQLLGYQMDEGAAAHTWLQFQVDQVHTLTTNFKVSNHPKTAAEQLLVFESLAEVRLDPRHNAIRLYDWGNVDCCLPRTALNTALAGDFQNLKTGDYLLVEDDKGHCDAVRLISAPQIVDAPIVSSPPGGKITIVQWSAATPLHFDYCIADVTVRGNMVVATHGETVTETIPVPAGGTQRLRMPLSGTPLAHLDLATFALIASKPVSPEQSAFTQLGQRSVSTLQVLVNGVTWRQQSSLLDSAPNAQVYRVEIDDAGTATIVFGQGGGEPSGQQFGLRPPDNATITATYRIGGGVIGNVGADTLVQLHSPVTDTAKWSVTNPLAAVGGRDLESRDHARRFAPATFKKPQVAVTAADYQNAAQSFTDINGNKHIARANASFRWSGSWLTVTLGVDVAGSEGLSGELRSDLLTYLDRVRLAGYDLEVTGGAYVPIDLSIGFCVATGFFVANVAQGIQRILSSGDLPGGGKGFFHPDSFSFGDALRISKLSAAVMSVAGVESARIIRIARLRVADPDADTRANLRQGFLAVGASEIIQLNNDRNFPERGVLTLVPLV